MAAKTHIDSPQAPAPTKIDRIARMPEVLALVGVGRTTLYKMVRDGRFPAPLHLSSRIRGWRLSSIQQFLASLEDE